MVTLQGEESPILCRGRCRARVCTDPPCLVGGFAPFVETRKRFVFLPLVLAKRVAAAGGRSPSPAPGHRGDAAGTGQAALLSPACHRRRLPAPCVRGFGSSGLGCPPGPVGEGPAEGTPVAGTLPQHGDWERQMLQKGKELVLLLP